MASEIDAAGRNSVRTWFVLLSLAAAAGAQNRLVLNPELDSDKMISSWSGLEIAWDEDDDADSCHLGPGLSGSVKSTSVEDAAEPEISVATAYPADCINVQPGQVVETEISYHSSFNVATLATFFPLANCGGVADPTTPIETWSEGAQDWTIHRHEFTVPANRLSMIVGWASFDFENSVFDAHFDRAYVGASERVSSDDFEVRTFCRWSGFAGLETTPPTDPGPLTSESHDGGSAPPPLLVAWGASTDEGSGLRTYLVGLADFLGEVPCSAITTEVGLTTSAGTDETLAAGTYWVYVCAEDWAGNQSGVTVGGPYEVD